MARPLQQAAAMDEALLNLVKAATWLAIVRRYHDEARMGDAVTKVCAAVDAVLERADELDQPQRPEPSIN
jgi:hypothetical protein